MARCGVTQGMRARDGDLAQATLHMQFDHVMAHLSQPSSFASPHLSGFSTLIRDCALPHIATPGCCLFSIDIGHRFDYMKTNHLAHEGRLWEVDLEAGARAVPAGGVTIRTRAALGISRRQAWPAVRCALDWDR